MEEYFKFSACVGGPVGPTQEAIKKMEEEERYKWLDSSKTKVLDTITGHKYDPLALIRIQNLYIEILEEKVFGGDNKWKN